MDDKLYHYRGKVLRVVDGDTLDIEFDLGLSIYTKRRVHLKGIVTPEIVWAEKASETSQRGMRAKAFVTERLMDKPVWVHVFRDKTGKFGRYTADVFFQDGEGKHVSICKLLLEDGLAEKWED